MDPFGNKIAMLITGAAGGLGAQLVKLAEELPGIDVIVATDINPAVTEHFAGNNKAMGIPMDVCSEDSIREVKHLLIKQGIRIKYLINNAGTHAFFPLSESTTALLDQVMRVNVYGPVLMVSAFLDDLIATKGRVIQISSDSVRLPIPFYAYPASKMAQEAFSVSMRRELQLHGIKLVMIRPGAMQTHFLEGMANIRNEVNNSRYQQWFEKFAGISRESVGKRLQPAEVATLVMRVVNTKNPGLVYSINKNRKISFFNIFPERIKDRLIARSVS